MNSSKLNRLPEKWFIRSSEALIKYFNELEDPNGFVGDNKVAGYYIENNEWILSSLSTLKEIDAIEITLEDYLNSIEQISIDPHECIKSILKEIGENPQREGLIDTPKRVIKSWGELYSGYNQDPKDIMTVFEEEDNDQIILLKNIELYSMCEHHMLPFYGKAHVAYIPNKKIVGISKLARLVEIYARRLQIQERIGGQVTDAIMKLLEAKGAACIIEASHMCMRMRGVSKQNSIMTTSSLKGVFLTDSAAKEELINLIKI